MVKYKNQHRGGIVYSIFSKNSFAGKFLHDIFWSLLQCKEIYATLGQPLRTSVLNPVIMVENICTLILAVHTILPHFKANFPLRVILFVSPYTQSREIFRKLLMLLSYKAKTEKNGGYRQQWISHKMNIWHPEQLKKKNKILGTILELPAKQQCHFGPFTKKWGKMV